VVDALVILDGATDPEPSTLSEAEMPALRRLRDGGSTEWVELLDPGVPVGSETAIASLLGWRPTGPVDRALVEAAARGSEGPVRRVDLDGGHRLLVFGDATLESEAITRTWPPGAQPPRILDRGTVIIGAPGAATGLGALMGARIVVPPGATGRPRSDLAGKRRATIDAIRGGATRVVVHVGGADAAAHDRDRSAKIAVLEAADRTLIGPLADEIGRLTVCADHGCDPATGRHLGGLVPMVRWSAA